MTRMAQEGRSSPKLLTPTERRIIAYIAENEGKPCSKAQIAEALGRNRKTIDRLLAHLREEGLIASTPMWGKDGAQLANSYRLVRHRHARHTVG